ncbi:zinc finger protein 70-like [Xenia sp. Carnegie-2017]|uniref:zinc finger protein 70-like n=1 Tax=Xenia sp. Carnegie-2017 TaxID=2897299 RepID=UPI001F0450B9|nr:zinc finger protein 70-like [Xenia sp. Carnegie-2017]
MMIVSCRNSKMTKNDIRQQQVSNTTYEVNSTIFPMNACTFQKQHETNLSGEHANFTEVLTTESANIRHSDMNSHFDEPETEERLAVDNLATERTDVVNDVINKNMEQNDQDVAHSNVTSHAGPGKAMESKPSSDKIIREPIRVKDSENKIKCSNCERVLSNMEEFMTHKCGKIARCSVCFKGFPRQSLLRQHMVLHQGSKRFRFTCNYCGRAFRHRSHLRDHERIHTGERPFKCSFCPKAFKQSSDHRKHENLHTGTTRYRCEKCSLDFKRCDALKRHAMLHSKGEVTLMKCEKCRSLFATADGHMTHVCQNKPYRYRCQICPKRFTEAENLRRHCYQHHTELFTDSQLRCEFCKMEFENLEKLDKHLTTHRLKKTHKCRTCGQKFSLLNQLVEHVKTHSDAPQSGNDTCNNGEFTPDQEHHEESPSNTATGDSWEGQEPMISSHSPQSIIVHPSPVWPQRQHYYFPMPASSMEPERRHDYTPSTIRQHTTSRPTSTSPPKQSSNMLQKDALSRSQTFSISRRESPIPLRSFSTSPRSNTAPSKIMPNPAQTSPNALRQFTTSRPNYYDVTNGPIPPQIYSIRNEAKTGREVATVIQNTARTTQQDFMTNSNVVDPGKSRERFMENPPNVQENIRANELVNDEKVGEVNPFNYRSNTTNPPQKQNTVDVLNRTFHGLRRHPDDIRMMAGAIRKTPERRHFTNSLKSPVKCYDDFIQRKTS